MSEITTTDLLERDRKSFDTERLTFVGLRGDPARHLARAELDAALTALPAAPRERGQVGLLLARGAAGERHLPDQVRLTVAGGMPGDRWASTERAGPESQLATAQLDIARVIANGQPLALHGDNLFLDLDLSAANLPAGSRVRAGAALLEVTEKSHNGCKKWAQRFGLDALKLNMAPAYRGRNVRGIYFRVVEEGAVRVGDPAVVVHRAEPVAGSPPPDS